MLSQRERSRQVISYASNQLTVKKTEPCLTFQADDPLKHVLQKSHETSRIRRQGRDIIQLIHRCAEHQIYRGRLPLIQRQPVFDEVRAQRAVEVSALWHAQYRPKWRIRIADGM